MLCLAVWGFSAAVGFMLNAHWIESDNNSQSFKTKWIKTDLGRLREREEKSTDRMREWERLDGRIAYWQYECPSNRGYRMGLRNGGGKQ